MYKWQQVKALGMQGASIKKIARTVKLSRNTVRKYLRNPDPPTFHAREYETIVAGYTDTIQAMREKHYIGTRIFNELLSMGYKGSLSTLHRYLRAIRHEEERKSKTTTRVETAPGTQMQYDWKEWNLPINGNTIKIYIHEVVLGYSRKKYYAYSVRITTQDVIRAIEGAIACFGGVPRELLIDNAKQMVVTHRKAGIIRYNDAFLTFCGLYGITPHPCKPYRARTKGKAERPFFYLEEHLLKGLEVENLAEFENLLRAFMDRYNARLHSTLKESPDVRFDREKDTLQEIPFVDPVLLYHRELRKVSNDGYISWKGNSYPVPLRLCLREVMVEEVYGRFLRVYDLSGQLMTHHELLLFDRGVRPVHPEHEAINRAYHSKREAHRSVLVKQFTETFGETGEQYLTELKAKVSANLYWHLEEILSYTKLYPAREVSQALAECMELGAYHKNSVKRLLGVRQIAHPSLKVSSAHLSVSPEAITRPLSDYRVEVDNG